MLGAVHVICATLREDAEPAAVERALALAHGLRDAEGARYSVAGRSARALVTATWLDGRDALEPFAASEQHMSFIMRGLAPCISGMWSAAVESAAGPPLDEPAALWAFALGDAETLYEWQVRDLLSAVEALPGAAAVGVTIEERERYRGGGVVCLAPGETEAFRATLEQARQRWGEVVATLAHELVTVEPPA